MEFPHFKTHIGRMTDDWKEKLRCPNCGKTGTASLHQGKSDDTPGKRPARGAYSEHANKTSNPAIGGPSCGCDSIGAPGRASCARPTDGMWLLGRHGCRDVLPMTEKHH